MLTHSELWKTNAVCQTRIVSPSQSVNVSTSCKRTENHTHTRTREDGAEKKEAFLTNNCTFLFSPSLPKSRSSPNFITGNPRSSGTSSPVWSHSHTLGSLGGEGGGAKVLTYSNRTVCREAHLLWEHARISLVHVVLNEAFVSSIGKFCFLPLVLVFFDSVRV